MAIILPPKPGIGGLLGSALGTGLGQLLQKREQEQQKQKGVQALSQAFNLNERQAQALQRLSPENQKQFFQQLQQREQGKQRQSGLDALKGHLDLEGDDIDVLKRLPKDLQGEYLKTRLSERDKKAKVQRATNAYMTLGLSHDKALAIASQPDQIQKEFLKSIARSGIPLEPGALKDEQPTEGAPTPEAATTEAAAPTPIEEQPPVPAEQAQPPAATQPTPTAPKAEAPVEPKTRMEQLQEQLREVSKEALPPEPERPKDLIGALAAPTPAEQRVDIQRRKLATEARIAPIKEEMRNLQSRIKDREKLSSAMLEENRKRVDTADEQLKRLKRMDNIARKGDLDSPGYINFIEGVGKFLGIPDVTFLKSLDTSALEKEAAQFAEMAKEFFGARVTDFDLKTLFKMIPNAKMTRDQQLLVSTGLQAVLKGKRAVAKEVDKIVEEYDKKGEPLPLPSQILSQARKRAAPRLEEYEDQATRTAEKIRKGDFGPVGKRKKFSSVDSALEKARPGDVLIVGGRRKRVGPNKEIQDIGE